MFMRRHVPLFTFPGSLFPVYTSFVPVRGNDRIVKMGNKFAPDTINMQPILITWLNRTRPAVSYVLWRTFTEARVAIYIFFRDITAYFTFVRISLRIC